MKTHVTKLVLSIFLILALESCKKNQAPTSVDLTNQIKGQNRIMLTALEGLNGEDLQLAYGTLTPDEIKAFWIEHIDTFKAHNTLSSPQLTVVGNLKAFIENNSLDLSSDSSHTLVRNFQTLWLPGAFGVFSNEQIFLLAYSLYDNIEDDYYYKQNPGGGGSHGGGGGGGLHKPCQCEQGSTYWACALHPTQCAANDCIPSSDGCGFLLFSTCDGFCNILL